MPYFNANFDLSSWYHEDLEGAVIILDSASSFDSGNCPTGIVVTRAHGNRQLCCSMTLLVGNLLRNPPSYAVCGRVSGNETSAFAPIRFASSSSPAACLVGGVPGIQDCFAHQGYCEVEPNST